MYFHDIYFFEVQASEFEPHLYQLEPSEWKGLRMKNFPNLSSADFPSKFSNAY